MQRQAAPRPNCLRKIGYFFSDTLVGLTGIGSAVPNVQYAATFSYDRSAPSVSPTQVSFSWLASLSPSRMAGALYNGLGTLGVSGTFGYRFLKIAKTKIYDEYQLFRQGKNTRRFVTETAMSLLAAITGASIAGGPFVGGLLWAARIVGFATIGGLSFLGMNQLIIEMTDKDYAFKMKVVEQLKMISPVYRAQVNALLEGRELTPENLLDFLNKVFTLAQQIEAQRLLPQADNATTIAPFFRQKTKEEMQRDFKRTAGDYAISGTLAGCCSTMYIQSGFSGTNAFLFNALDNLPTAAKIAVGFFPGLPLTLFAFFTIKFFNSPLFSLHPNVRQEPEALGKTALLATACVGNAAWYYGLAKMISENENIFSFLLNTSAGQLVFPWAAYLTCLNMGMNGLVPMVFPPRINRQNPTRGDVMNSLVYDAIPCESIQGLRRHSFFTGESKVQPEAKVDVLDRKVEAKVGGLGFS